MKTKFLLFLCLALVACQKEEVKPLKEPTWYLTFTAPDYSCENLPVSHVAVNLGAHQVRVGDCLDFQDGAFRARLFTEAGSVVQFTGIFPDDHAFGVHGSLINICGGVQGATIIYSLTYK